MKANLRHLIIRVFFFFFLLTDLSEYVTLSVVNFFSAHVVTVREQRIEKGRGSDVIKNVPPALFHNEIIDFPSLCKSSWFSLIMKPNSNSAHHFFPNIFCINTSECCQTASVLEVNASPLWNRLCLSSRKLIFTISDATCCCCQQSYHTFKRVA